MGDQTFHIINKIRFQNLNKIFICTSKWHLYDDKDMIAQTISLQHMLLMTQYMYYICRYTDILGFHIQFQHFHNNKLKRMENFKLHIFILYTSTK